jgi:Cysteine-rich CPCC
MIVTPASAADFDAQRSCDRFIRDLSGMLFWEDDPVQNEDPEFAGGANKLSLGTARDNYIRFGASDQAAVRYVRPPLIEEVPLLGVAAPKVATKKTQAVPNAYLS